MENSSSSSSSPPYQGRGGRPDDDCDDGEKQKSQSSNSLLTLDTSTTSGTAGTATMKTTTQTKSKSPLNIDDQHQQQHQQQQRRSSTIRYEPATHQRPSFHANIAPTTTGTINTRTRRKSFLVEFSQTNGPPQIAGLMMLIAIGLGCTIGVVPAVMTDRFARLRHGYDLPERCWEFTTTPGGGGIEKPDECFLGSADAQTAVSTSNLISNVLTFVSSSLIGSLSDEYGRRGTSV